MSVHRRPIINRFAQRSSAQLRRGVQENFSVELVKPGNPDGMHLWPWVYADGSFHPAGKMQAVK
jgi:hypothetical protein